MKSRSKRLKSYFNTNPITSGSIEDLKMSLEQYTNSFKAKFDESLDVCFKLNVPKSKKSSVNIKSFVVFPFDFSDKSRKKKILVLTSPENIDHVKSLGINLVGSSELVDDILKDSFDFDLLVCTSDFLPSISKLAKKLGPKGLMPSIKNDTVCDLQSLVDTLSRLSSNRIQLKMNSDFTIKCSFSRSSIDFIDSAKNFSFLKDSILSLKPKELRVFGSFILSISISSTMGFKFSVL